MSHVLVTGGAGFIGGHLVRGLLDAGHEVRVIDSLERPSHTTDEPRDLDPRARFQRGDMRRKQDLIRGLEGIDTVCHLAATGGYTTHIGRYLRSNSVGTANLLEVIRERRLPVRRILVASSMAVYGEGDGRCPEHGSVRPASRRLERLAGGRYEPTCPECDAELEPLPTAETSAVAPERPYSISKYDQERLVLSLASEIGYEAAALRFFVTYGPRQSLSNPYTGVISIFANRIAAGEPPVIYEDGRQTRDFIYVEDVVSAHVHLLARPSLDGRPYNVGAGRAVGLAELAAAVAEALGSPLTAELPGSYRLGDVRHISADNRRLRELGWEPSFDLAAGLERYVEWFRGQRDSSGESFASAHRRLARSGLIRQS